MRDIILLDFIKEVIVQELKKRDNKALNDNDDCCNEFSSTGSVAGYVLPLGMAADDVSNFPKKKKKKRKH